MATPVVVVESGGLPVTQVAGTIAAAPFTPVEPPLTGLPVTLVETGGYPMALVNEDYTPWNTHDAALLLETGDLLLLESGDFLLLEA